MNELSSPVEARFLLVPKAQLFPAKVGFGIVTSEGRVIKILPPLGIGRAGTIVNKYLVVVKATLDVGATVTEVRVPTVEVSNAF